MKKVIAKQGRQPWKAGFEESARQKLLDQKQAAEAKPVVTTLSRVSGRAVKTPKKYKELPNQPYRRRSMLLQQSGSRSSPASWGASAVAYLASPSALYGLALGPLVFALPRLLELNAALHERLVERTMLRRPDRNYLRGHRYMTMEQYERFGEQTTRAELANLYNSPEFQRHVARKAQSGYRIEFVPFGQHTPRTPGEHGAADCDEDSDE